MISDPIEPVRASLTVIVNVGQPGYRPKNGPLTWGPAAVFERQAPRGAPRTLRPQWAAACPAVAPGDSERAKRHSCAQPNACASRRHHHRFPGNCRRAQTAFPCARRRATAIYRGWFGRLAAVVLVAAYVANAAGAAPEIGHLGAAPRARLRSLLLRSGDSALGRLPAGLQLITWVRLHARVSASIEVPDWLQA